MRRLTAAAADERARINRFITRVECRSRLSGMTLAGVRMTNFRVLAGLPPYGALAVPFPRSWAAAAREGLVVEFTGEDGIAWVGNFRPGIGGLDEVRRHPNASDVLVISAGDTWVINPTTRAATEIVDAVDALWPVSEPEGVVLSAVQRIRSPPSDIRQRTTARAEFSSSNILFRSSI